jgi:hypothetical protein
MVDLRLDADRSWWRLLRAFAAFRRVGPVVRSRSRSAVRSVVRSRSLVRSRSVVSHSW